MNPAFPDQIPVCLQCGSRELKPQGIREGLWPGGGEGVAWVCRRCGHIGQPLLLDPEDRQPSARDELWQKEYQETARRLDEPRDLARKGRRMRQMGLLLLLLAAVFFLPPMLLVTNALTTGDAGMVPGVLGQSWIFLGIGVVALVMGARKMDQAARLGEQGQGREKAPLERLEEMTREQDKP